MIDLHMHTTKSDGSDTPIELLKKCEEEKLEYISITDHDTALAYEELESINIKDYYSGTIIPGVELATCYNGIIIEILGYDIDYNVINKCFPYDYIKEKSKRRKQYTYDRTISKLKELGIIVDKEKLNKDFSADVALYYYLIQNVPNVEEKLSKELMENVNSFFRKGISNPKSFLYVDNERFYLSPKEVVDLIHKAGGKAFLAHAYIYSYDDIIKFINELRNNADLDGLEVYHSSFSKEQSDSLIEYCKKNNLYMSGGSDYHGKVKPFIKLKTGTNNLNISKDILTWY